MKYLVVEGTRVQKSIKNKNIEVKKKRFEVSYTHSEQQCCTHQNSR